MHSQEDQHSTPQAAVRPTRETPSAPRKARQTIPNMTPLPILQSGWSRSKVSRVSEWNPKELKVFGLEIIPGGFVLQNQHQRYTSIRVLPSYFGGQVLTSATIGDIQACHLDHFDGNSRLVRARPPPNGRKVERKAVVLESNTGLRPGELHPSLRAEPREQYLVQKEALKAAEAAQRRRQLRAPYSVLPADSVQETQSSASQPPRPPPKDRGYRPNQPLPDELSHPKVYDAPKRQAIPRKPVPVRSMCGSIHGGSSMSDAG